MDTLLVFYIGYGACNQLLDFFQALYMCCGRFYVEEINFEELLSFECYNFINKLIMYFTLGCGICVFNCSYSFQWIL